VYIVEIIRIDVYFILAVTEHFFLKINKISS